MSDVLSIEFELLDYYGLSALNNSIPLIDEIIIRNDCEYNLKNLEVEVSASPSFFSAYTKKILEIQSGRYVIINDCALDIDITKLMYLSKITPTVVTVKIKNSGEILASVSKNMTLLPFDHIAPITVYPELISAFVTPKQPEIEALTLSVEDGLKDHSFVHANRETWQRNNKTTTEAIIKSVYETIKYLKITINTSPSFSETSPFKANLPEKILNSRNGNSLEIAFLFCSLMESTGINPFIVLLHDNVLVGAFYTPDCFDCCVSESKNTLSALNNGKCDRFCAIDVTSIVNGIDVSFENSLLSAQKKIDKCDSAIIIDICSARLHGYNPMSNRLYQQGNVIFEVLQSTNKPSYLSNEFDASVFNSSTRFTDFIKSKILSKEDSEKLIATDTERCIYLIGSSKFIAGKLIINQNIIVRHLPLNDVLSENEDLYVQLDKLNKGINTADMSAMVKSIHPKNSFNRRVDSIATDIKKTNASVCLALGTFNYMHNNERICSPLLFIKVGVDIYPDNSIELKLRESRISVNIPAVNTLSKKGIDLGFLLTSDNLIDNYDDIISSISNVIEDSDVEYYDTVSVITLNTEGQGLSSIANAAYFEKSSILFKAFNKLPLSSVPYDKPSLLCTPFSLDSSQASAFMMAKSNECTIIKGSNASGKTLLNASIAFSELYDKRKVLYITDTKGNLTDFLNCSRTAGFYDFVLNADDTSCAENVFNPSAYERITANSDDEVLKRLTELISSQNLYYENLHRVNEIGFSLYEAASQYERYRSFPFSVNFSNEEISSLLRDDVVAWLDCVSTVAKAGADCKEPYSNPLSPIQENVFSYDFKSRATIMLNAHLKITNNFLEKQQQIIEYFAIETPILKENQTTSLIKMINCILKNADKIHFGIFGRDSIESDFSIIEALTLKCDNLFELKKYMESHFADDVITLDCDSLLNEWRNAQSRFAFTKASAQNSVKNKIKTYCLDSKYITNDNFIEVVSAISRYKATLNSALEASSLVYQISGIDIKNAIDTNDVEIFSHLKEIIAASREYLSLILEVCDGEIASKSISTHQSLLFKNKKKLLEDISALSSDFENHYNLYLESEKQLCDLLKIDLPSIKADNRKIWYYYVTQFLQRMADNIDLLKYWCNWNVEKEKAIKLGLGKVIALYEGEQLSSTDIKNAFLKGFFKSITEYFLSDNNSVSHIFSEAQDNAISLIHEFSEKYRSLISTNMQSNVNEEFARVSGSGLSQDNLKNNFSYILDTCNDHETANLIQAAKPCFVCSSTEFVARFNNHFKFDTIIIDMDSFSDKYNLFMLFPIADKIIISQNLENNPMTDALIEFGAPVAKLNYIYSANYLSHIVNELFYENTMSVFPCSDKSKTGINLIKQSGVYDQNARVNLVEASATVDEIIRIKNEHSDASIGVYTLTEQQCALVKLLHSKRCGNDESISVNSLSDKEYRARDYVIFSTVISSDKSNYDNKIKLGVSELTSKDITTALKNLFLSPKREFSVITSLSKKDLTDFKTTEKGYNLFKKLLLRVISEKVMTIQENGTTLPNENPIIREVSNHIESLGYKTELNYGINKCKIDIAVRRKGESKYLLGILFDESVYINCDDFVSRDLMISSFENIGDWKILRIYTVDWFENQAKQLDVITEALNGNQFEEIFTDTVV